MRAQLRFFQDDDRIDVQYSEAPFNEQVAHSLQESQARNILPSRSGIRKMRADIAKPRRAEQRVADGVGQRVAVGVSRGPLVERNLDAAEDEFAALREAVKVIADPRTGHRDARSSRR